MWGLGCSFYELFSAVTIKDKKDSFDHILFPGESSFPLSPLKQIDQEYI
jgi:hypothetical protein